MIALVNMPFGSMLKPPLAMGLIQAMLDDAALPARSLYLNFILARAMGYGAYETLARYKGVYTQVSEWLFADACWRREFGPDEDEFLALCGGELEHIPNVDDPVRYLRKIRHDVVPAFLEASYQRIVERGVPEVVGFSCMFFQTVAALALGRMLKERHPRIRLVYGGACFHGEMGEELFRIAPWIDAVALGEVDSALVPLFRSLLAGEMPTGLAGIMARARDGSVVVGPPTTLIEAAELERQPVPNFDGFFEAAGWVGLAEDPAWIDRMNLHFEAARGCWWGAKKHCTFCGLNPNGMAFREKSAERVLAQMRHLAARYSIRNLNATDNILSMKYFDTLLPRLAEEPITSHDQPVRLFFETKSNLTRAHVQALQAAGITAIQPGIESLATGTLAAFDKGVTAIQNVYLLKCCAEHGVSPTWNLLIRVPGETRADYEQMEHWLPLLFHLRPPAGGAPRIECHRFSPYFTRTGEFVDDLRPAQWYRGLFPEDQVDLAKVAYYFDVTWKHTLGDPAYDRLLELVGCWRQLWWKDGEQPRLTLRDTGSHIVIDDTRAGELVTWQLSERASAVYRHLADLLSVQELMERTGLSDGEVGAELAGFVDKGLAIHEGRRYLGLALSPEAPAVATRTRRMDMAFVANQRPTRARTRLPIIP